MSVVLSVNFFFHDDDDDGQKCTNDIKMYDSKIATKIINKILSNNGPLFGTKWFENVMRWFSSRFKASQNYWDKIVAKLSAYSHREWILKLSFAKLKYFFLLWSRLSFEFLSYRLRWTNTSNLVPIKWNVLMYDKMK